MSKLVLTDAKVYFGGYDISGDMNGVDLGHEAEMQAANCFGDTTKINLSGLQAAALGMAGYVNLADDGIDEQLAAAIGVSDTPVSVIPEGLTVGNRGYFFQSVLGQYSPQGQHGGMFRFDAKAFCRGPLIAGKLEATGTKSSSSNSTGAQLGALSATQSLYAAAHVLSVSGSSTPTMALKVQSDDNSGFTSATDRITFTNFTAIGAQIASVAGAVTDDYWRFVWTLSGTSPVFGVRLLFGIR